MEDVEMTWGDNDKSVVPTATVGEDEYDGSFTYESSDANLTVAPNGKLTCNFPGTYTVTAKIAATGSHQAAEKTCTVTVNKQDITLSFGETDVVKLAGDANYTQTANYTPAAYDGTISYSKSGNASIDSSTAEVTFTETGVNTITATAPATDLYNGNTASYTLYVKTTPTITVSDQTLAIGDTYEPTITGGTVTISSDKDGVISVSDNVITAEAVVAGATITVATAANDTYIAGEETFTLTVNGAPAGLTAVPEPEAVTVFYESFDKCSGTGGNDSQWSGNIASTNWGSSYGDNGSWSMTWGYVANKCVRMGKGSGLGTAQTPKIALENGKTYTLTFRAGAWNGKSTNLKVSMTNGTLSASSVTMKNAAFDNFSLTITNASADAQITFEGNAVSDSQFFLDEVKITRPGDPISTTVSLNKYGYATYCSEYPIDFTNTDGYTAWRVESITSEGVITFKKITEKIKGGQGVLLYNKDADGVNTSSATITFADGTTEFDSSENLLVGKTARTYVADNEYYGLSGNQFVKVNAGIIPAGKALLPANLVDGSNVKSLNFVFEETTGITRMETITLDNDAWYDLTGRKVAEPTQGIYIHNGKKVFINK